MDITGSQMYFTELIHVIHGRIHDRFHPTHTRGRHSDAFVYILSGSCRYTFDTGRDFTVQQGDILYLANKSVYTMRLQTLDYEYIFCDFVLSGSTPADSDFFPQKNQAEAEDRFRKLLYHYRHPTESSFCQCLSELYGIYAMVRQSRSAGYLPRSAKQRVAAAKAHLEAHPEDPNLTIAALAEQAGMSQVLFRQHFRTLYGCTPGQALSNARLRHATRLMVSYPFLTLEECALQSGFTTVQYFCRVFKKAMGTTPAAYRRSPPDDPQIFP